MVSFKSLFSVLALIILTGISSVPVYAQQLELGQLFTSPQERAYLDMLRQQFLERTQSQGFDIQTEEIPLIETAESQQNVEFQLGAIMTNANGSHIIWLNGAPVSEFDLPNDVDLVSQAGQNILRIRTNSATYYLKPGQTLNLETGERWEAYQPRPSVEEDIAEEETSASDNIDTARTATTINNEEIPTSQPRGVVAIQDLIEALQQVQAGNNNAGTE